MTFSAMCGTNTGPNYNLDSGFASDIGSDSERNSESESEAKLLLKRDS